jgi:hypothetical protein
MNVGTDTDTYKRSSRLCLAGTANVTTGIENTLIGGLAGDALTDADYNVAVGMQALSWQIL